MTSVSEPQPARPVPLVTPESERFWHGCRAHELWVRACNPCGTWYFYPRDVCPVCGSRDVEWRQSSGQATLHTFAIAYRPPRPAFAPVTPYVIAIVELEEGARMLTNLVDIEPDPQIIRIGMDLTVTFEDLTDTVSLPKFRPV
jgi:uncharacterized OB-fold protein